MSGGHESGAGARARAGAGAADGDGSADRLTPVLRPVRAGNGFEEALEQILRVLRLGLVPCGERLPAERELAERLGVSRVTLREVLKVLTEQGLVESRRGRYGGTFVLPRPEAGDASGAGAGTGAGRAGAAGLPRPRGGTAGPVSGAGIEDTLRFREVLETGAAGLCAGDRLSGERAARLRTALAATRDAPTGDYRRLDTLFHLTLAELSGSPALAGQYAAVRADLNEMLDRIPLLVRNLEHSQAQHAALVDAVLAGDAEGARAVMREHCEATASLLRGFLS